ncbi:hypothetical protein DPX16_4293 [Anabarilius grahami]|uniref:Uncharacterized protein n=1 Tax=Anabarilius grahami TaxID=495550 RepID=A0A3N0YDP4_ANAGA|nr:hypothetical protein DPX16_4293 [Anabarilius grahami]
MGEEEFLELYHEVRWDNGALKYLYWNGMDDILGQMLLMKEGCCPLIDFIDYIFWMCGSSFTVGVIEEDNINSPSQYQLQQPSPCLLQTGSLIISARSFPQWQKHLLQ